MHRPIENPYNHYRSTKDGYTLDDLRRDAIETEAILSDIRTKPVTPHVFNNEGDVIWIPIGPEEDYRAQ